MDPLQPILAPCLLEPIAILFRVIVKRATVPVYHAPLLIVGAICRKTPGCLQQALLVIVLHSFMMLLVKVLYRPVT